MAKGQKGGTAKPATPAPAQAKAAQPKAKTQAKKK
jgi:hypothetical protein